MSSKSKKNTPSSGALLGRKSKPQEVVVPEWGDAIVYVRHISGNEKIEMKAVSEKIDRQYKDGGAIHLQCHAVARFTVDDKGGRVFNDDDTDRLLEEPATAIQRIWDAFVKFNRLGADSGN